MSLPDLSELGKKPYLTAEDVSSLLVVEQVGGREQIQVETRVIAASNRDLKESVKDGSFREGLHFRLGVIMMSLPLSENEKETLSLLLEPSWNVMRMKVKKDKGFHRFFPFPSTRYL